MRAAFNRGVQSAFEKFGLALPQSTLKALTPGHGIPTPPDLSASPLRSPSPLSQLKSAANVGMGASNNVEAIGSVRGEPADAGRRQRSVIDQAFSHNDTFNATSSMPAPGGNVSP